MSRPPLYGVGIFVPVSDLKRSTAWYTEMLGLEIIHRDEPDAIVMRMNDEKVSFCLVRSGEVKQPVFPNNNYGVKKETIVDMPFMEHQDKKKVKNSPMMTFDLDMFYALMKTLSGYPAVTMHYKDSSTGVYFRAEGDEYLPTVEAVMGPTIQHIRGKVWLP